MFKVIVVAPHNCFVFQVLPNETQLKYSYTECACPQSTPEKTQGLGGTGRDSFNLCGGKWNDNGTVKTWKVGGMGQQEHIFSTGRDGKNQRDRFSRRDGTVNIFSPGGTGR